MAMKVKWDITGKGDEAWGGDFQTYDGDTPPKGNYIARVKRMTLGAIKSGENKGKPRISVLLEICGGAGSDGIDNKKYPYLGAPVWDGLNIIKSQTGKVNNFLHALTDGEDNSKRAVETAFWPPNGPKADRIKKDGKPDVVHLIQIGKYPVGSPDGHLLVRIVTKMGADLEGNPRAEVNQYLPYIDKTVNNGAALPGVIDGDIEEGEEPAEEDEDELDIQYEEEDIQDLDAQEGPPF